MKQFLFSVYDAKAAAFAAPVLTINKNAAIRSFSDAVAAQGSELGKHPEDYSLFLLGSFDPLSGKIEPLKSPEQVITALECKAA